MYSLLALSCFRNAHIVSRKEPLSAAPCRNVRNLITSDVAEVTRCYFYIMVVLRKSLRTNLEFFRIKDLILLFLFEVMSCPSVFFFNTHVHCLFFAGHNIIGTDPKGLAIIPIRL